MIRTYLYGIVAALLAAAFVADGIYYYNKGKDSVFKGVLAGVATAQKADEKKAEADVAQSAEDAAHIANLERDKHDLQKKLAALANAHPQPECKLDADSLSSLKAISDSTKP